MWSCGASGCCDHAQVTSQGPGAGSPATGHRNIHYYSVVFAVQSSSASYALGVCSVKECTHSYKVGLVMQTSVRRTNGLKLAIIGRPPFISLQQIHL